MEAARVQVRGRVQGVWFRASTQKSAQQIGVFGWVQNADDGSVEIYVEGERPLVDRFIEWCHEGSPLSRVKEVDVEWVAPEGLTTFEIR